MGSIESGAETKLTLAVSGLPARRPVVELGIDHRRFNEPDELR